MELERSLVAWFGLLDLTRSPKMLSDFSDGVAFFELMSRVSPDLFDFSQVVTTEAESLHIKVANLRRLNRGLENLYREVIGMSLEDFGVGFDPLEYAKKGDKGQALRLMEIIIAAIVKCECKPILSRLRDLTDVQQGHIMQYIKALESRLGATTPSQDDSAHFRKEVTQLRADTRAAQQDNLALRTHLRQVEAENEELKKQSELRVETEPQPPKSPRSTKETGKLTALLEEKDHSLAETQRELLTARRELKAVQTKFEDELQIATERIQWLERCEAELATARQTIDSLRAQRAKAAEAETTRKSLEEKITSMQSDINEVATLRAKLKLTEDQLRDSQLRETEQQSVLADRQREIELLKSQAAVVPKVTVSVGPSAEEWAAKLKESEEERERLKAEVRRSKDEATDACAKHNSVVAEMKKMYQDKDALSHRYLVSMEEATQLRSALAEKEAALKLLEARKPEVIVAAPEAEKDKYKVKKMELQLENMKLSQELQKLREVAEERTKALQVLETENERLESTWRKTLSEAQSLHLSSHSDVQRRLDEEIEQNRILTLQHEDMKEMWLREQQLMATALLSFGIQIIQGEPDS